MARLEYLSKQLRATQKQIPYAIARASASVARQILEAGKAQMKKVSIIIQVGM